MNRLRDLREDKDLTQEQIGKIIGISQRKYSYYETETSKITPEVLRNLAIFYETSIDYILCLTDIKSPYPRKKGLK